MKTQFCGLVGGLLFLANFVGGTSFGALYTGNGNSSINGSVGNGTLTMNGNNNSVTAIFHDGTGNFTAMEANLVIFIDSVPGGFNNTAAISDRLNISRQAVSGYLSSGARSAAQFASGFGADYAIVLGNNNPGNVSMYRLVAGDDGSLEQVLTQYGLSYTEMGGGNYSVRFNWTDIGRSPGAGNSFTFESTYIRFSGMRSGESFQEAVLDNRYPPNTLTFNSVGSFPDPIPETSNAALAIFGGLAMCGSLGARVRCLFRVRTRG